MDWSPFFPAYIDNATTSNEPLPRPLIQDVEVADIGCGFGGLLVALAPQLPKTLILGVLSVHAL